MFCSTTGELRREPADSCSDPTSTSITLAKIQNPMKSGFDKVNDDLKKVHKGQSSYGKALDRVGIPPNSTIVPY